MRNKNIFLNISIGVLAVILVGSLVFLFIMLNGYRTEAKDNKNISDNAIISTNLDKANVEAPNDAAITIDYSYLNSINSDCLGYILIPNTNISYPIVQGTDNDKYLDTSFTNTSTKSGSIFLDYRNTPYLSDSFNLIYGHNMKDSSMFADINKYSDEDYYKEHSDVYISMLSGQNVKYNIVSVVMTGPYDEDIYDYSFDTLSKEDLVKRLVNIKSKSLYETYNPVDFDKPIVVLSTCRTNGTKRMCLVLQSSM